MKSAHTIQLIASVCLMFGSVINLLNICTEIPFAVCILSIPLLLAAIVLYGVAFRMYMANKKSDETNDDDPVKP